MCFIKKTPILYRLSELINLTITVSRISFHEMSIFCMPFISIHTWINNMIIITFRSSFVPHFHKIMRHFLGIYNSRNTTTLPLQQYCEFSPQKRGLVSLEANSISSLIENKISFPNWWISQCQCLSEALHLFG